MVKSLIFFF